MSATLYSSTPLTSGWTFKDGLPSSNARACLPANDAPTEVHRDLLKNGKIADPFQDLNELLVRWVNDQTWTYRTTFAAPADYGKLGVNTTLRFEGLDTFATVYLNAENLFESENMFVEHRVSVSGKLYSRYNVLEIVFESARKRGLEIVDCQKEHQFIVHQTEISRGPVRKAQYHWGWDWGPILTTCGPWKPITLEMWTCRLSNPYAQYELSADMKSANFKLSVQCEGQITTVAFSTENIKTEETVGTTSVNIIAD